MKTFSLNNRRYLGNKYKLTDFIHSITDKYCKNIHSVMDLFAGTGVVGYSFNEKCQIIMNDILRSNEVAYYTFLGSERISKKKIEKLISYYNSISVSSDNYYSFNFADTYLSRDNLRKVGFIRDNIDELYDCKEINYREKCCLICSLLYAIDHIANTVGHYDAYRKNGELNRELLMLMPDFPENKYNRENKIYKEDSNKLVKSVSADLIYIDPPYNSRQYCDCYHFLENVAENNKPEVFGIAKKMDRTSEKSDYCTNKAPEVFADLIKNIKAKYILVSYNNTGDKADGRSNARISDEQILSILKGKGKVRVFEEDYKPFTTGKTKLESHSERLFLCEVTPDKPVKSPLNYTGGKYEILPQLQALFPNKIDTFYDIFCGGFNVGINQSAKKIIGIDDNQRLINLLQYLQQSSYGDLIISLDNATEYYGLSNTSAHSYTYYNCDSSSGLASYNKNSYNQLKKDYNNDQDNSILFLLLIIFGFNNQIRFNSRNEFNLPVGKRDLNDRLRQKLKDFMERLHSKNISFECKNFRDIDLKNIHKGDFLYLDPPYLLGTASYNENDGWNESDETDLLNFLNRCNGKNIRFALSNVTEHKGNQNTILKDWITANHYKMNYIKKNYNNSNYHKKDKTGTTTEVLITNY